ncbi:Por secretion system C-terminal sorting domain-containing protein [Dyadobacter soli]|uniref:Por secretion system C-terminal sorting domain-containing protein n=1 Tax=Dyadobacter soli TaxID=659014 RepID=A0A1G7G017_9BACT|nr:M43 family zinc metalloprotease [Dyadobacter soli]SDE81487.1 Por secretion system C-terminal sorting domain-containing protein [Dyadobacter soli]
MKNITRLLPAGVCCFVVVAALWLPVAVLHAQPLAGPICSTTPQHQKLAFSKSQRQIFDEAQKRLKAHLASGKAQRTGAVDQVYTIPVVVHILEPIGYSILTDLQVEEGIAELNKAFRNQLVESDGVDTQIQFKLAVRSPQCTPTTGIDRIPTHSPEYTTNGVTGPGGAGLPYDQVYPMGYWSNLEYYNVWVVNYMDQAAGFAAYPTGAASTMDGVMIMAPYFTTKLLAHEFGHGMFLAHTFSRGIGEGELDYVECPLNDNCAAQGDNICDTEPVNQSANYLCPGDANPLNLCNNNTPYGNVLKNYMGYNTFACQTQFTNDQRTRMRGAIETLRSGLINSKGLDPVVIAQSIPKGTSTTLNATNCNGLIQWYDAPSAGNHLAGGSSYTTPVLQESRTYYVSCLRADCPSDVRVPAVVTVGALPVTLVRFGAELLEQNQVLLSWSTSFETMHDHFDVESAYDAKTFRTVGQAWEPLRKTGGISEYQLTDTPSQAGELIYYRLKQVDRGSNGAEGSFAYSKIVHVRMPGTQQVTISPNPAEQSITISGVSQNWDVEVTNAAGVVVQQVRNQSLIDSKQLPAGLYVVRVTTESGYVLSKKIIKK